MTNAQLLEIIERWKRENRSLYNKVLKLEKDVGALWEDAAALVASATSKEEAYLLCKHRSKTTQQDTSK